MIALVVWSLWSAGASASQVAGITTGAITGIVSDATGAVLPDATVTVTGDGLIGAPRTANTNSDGFYRIVALSPGQYTVRFARDRFTTVRQEGIHVGTGAAATVNATLAIAALGESVRVAGAASALFDTGSAAKASHFDRHLLDSLPGSRSAAAILGATPAVSVSQFEVGGNSRDGALLYTAFGTGRANRPMVEGIAVSGMFPLGVTLDYGSFEEVTVGTGVHSVEWPLPGVQMQFISKSGGNRYHGTLYGDYERRNWQAINIDAGQIARGAEGGIAVPARQANQLWSYRDVNADVGGFIRRDRLWWYASFRDQDIAARQVNFPVRPRRTHTSNYTLKTTYQITPGNKAIVFGQASRNHQPNLLGGFRIAAASAISPTTESTAAMLAWGGIWKAELNSVVSDRVVLDIRVGGFNVDRMETSNGTAPRFEDVTTSEVRGGNRDWELNLRRLHTLGSVNVFKNGWFGSHQFRIGGEAYRNLETETWHSSYAGDVLHVLRDNQASEVYLFETPSRSGIGFFSYSAYASDSWRLNARLTLTPGARFDRYRVFLPEQAHPQSRFNPAAQFFPAVDNVIDFNLFAPRLAAIYDVTGDATTLLKVSYSHYWYAPGTDFGAAANPNSSQWWRHYSWSDPNRDGLWEVEETGVFIDSSGGASLESLDPDVKLPLVKEVAAFIDHDLGGGVALRTGAVWRRESNHYLRQNASRPFNAFIAPVTIPDPGADGIAGTGDDGAAMHGWELPAEIVSLAEDNVVRNVPDSDSEFWTWDVTASRRFSDGWSLVAGFAHTWNRDQANRYLGQVVRQNLYAVTPNDLLHTGRDGRYEFRTWSAKVYGTYTAPWNLQITPYLRHQSGQPYGRTVTANLNYGRSLRFLAEPIDSRRTDNVTILDLRVQKGFGLLEGRRVAVFADVFNVLNANPDESISWTSGPSFQRPLNIVAPRIVRVGARLDW
jgi:hypothetical protein